MTQSLSLLFLVLFTTHSALSAEPDETRRGRKLFSLCVQCHGVNAQGMESSQAPALAGLAKWYLEAQIKKYQKGIRGSHPQDKHGHRMRPFSYMIKSDEDVSIVASYISNLKKVESKPTLTGDAEKGAKHYATCVACHMENGEGNKELNSPNLKIPPDWYLLRQLESFKKGWRGSDPNDVTGAQMRAMSMTLADTQAMLDVVAYIQSLKETNSKE